ncbi:MAG: family 10 glycosylhydrolase [Candidatus Brocadiia bacterium]
MRAIACLLLAAGLPAAAGQGELRGVWMHATQVKSRAEADGAIARIEAANLNAIFILVWYWGGQAFFHTPLCPMGEGVEEGHDPLGHMVAEAHRRDIEVHAWFVNGAYGASSPRHVLDEHPEWAVDTGGESEELWYDFGKPQVRQFQSDLMIGCLRRYDVDGLHFDYIRYGPRMCWCEHCQAEFARRTGFEPLSPERRAQFPVLAAVSSNPVVQPTTATVLVEFSSGVPAIALNRLGEGEVLVLNWHAEKSRSPAVTATLQRTLERWEAEPGKVVCLDTEPNRRKYGRRFTHAAVQWLRKLGTRPRAVREDRLADLPADAVVVLPCLYYIPQGVAEQLEARVRRGAHLVVIDGPVYAIARPAVQRLVGFKAKGRYFSDLVALVATGESELAPDSGRKLDLAREKRRGELWAEYRKDTVTALVRDVGRRARAVEPRALVSAAVFTPLASAEHVLQDWPRWLREHAIDLAIPMAYTRSNESLEAQVAEWKSLDPRLQWIVPGLSIYQRTEKGTVTRDIDLVLAQRRLCREAHARGTVFFSLHYLDDALTEALRTGPFAQPARPYHPPPRP